MVGLAEIGPYWIVVVALARLSTLSQSAEPEAVRFLRKFPAEQIAPRYVPTTPLPLTCKRAEASGEMVRLLVVRLVPLLFKKNSLVEDAVVVKKFVVVAEVPVAFKKVKFCKVVEPVARIEPAAAVWKRTSRLASEVVAAAPIRTWLVVVAGLIPEVLKKDQFTSVPPEPPEIELHPNCPPVQVRAELALAHEVRLAPKKLVKVPVVAKRFVLVAWVVVERVMLLKI